MRSTKLRLLYSTVQIQTIIDLCTYVIFVSSLHFSWDVPIPLLEQTTFILCLSAIGNYNSRREREWSRITVLVNALDFTHRWILVTGPSILVCIFMENQQMHQNDHLIVMLSQTLLQVSAYQRHHQGAHTILTSYLYVGVHYRKNNGISTEVAAISIVALLI
jgi:hypothetical protein